MAAGTFIRRGGIVSIIPVGCRGAGHVVTETTAGHFDLSLKLHVFYFQIGVLSEEVLMSAFERFEAGVCDGEGIVDKVLEAAAGCGGEGGGEGGEAGLHFLEFAFVGAVGGRGWFRIGYWGI